MTAAEAKELLKECIETEDGFLCWTWDYTGTRLIRVFVPKD